MVYQPISLIIWSKTKKYIVIVYIYKMSANLPKELNYASNRPMGANGKPYINRFRSDGTVYSGNDVIKIEIPTGRNGTYLFGNDSYIEGKIRLSATNTAAAKKHYIDQSIFSIINRIRVYHGSNIVEDTLYCNKIYTALYDLQVNESERRGDCITKLVNDNTADANLLFNDGCTGRLVLTTGGAGAATTGSWFDFAFVLPSALLGSLCSKALPLGSMGSASIYLEIELSSPQMAFVTDAEDTTAINYEVGDIYYNAKMTTLPSDINDMLIESTGGFINIPAVAYKCESKTISPGSSSFNDKFSFQFSSMKNFNFFFQNSATAIGNSKYRSVSSRPRCSLEEFFLLINGEAYPSSAVKGTSRIYQELLRAWDMQTDTNAGGVISGKNYSMNTHTAPDDVLVANAVATPQKRFLAGIDLDKFNRSSDVLMAGTSSIGQMVSLQLNFSAATTDTLNLYSFVQYDVLFHIEGGLISPKF